MIFFRKLAFLFLNLLLVTSPMMTELSGAVNSQSHLKDSASTLILDSTTLQRSALLVDDSLDTGQILIPALEYINSISSAESLPEVYPEYDTVSIRKLESTILEDDTSLYLADYIKFLNASPQNIQATNKAKNEVKKLVEQFLSRDTLYISVDATFDRPPSIKNLIKAYFAEEFKNVLDLNVKRTYVQGSDADLSITLKGHAVGVNSIIGYIYAWSDIQGTLAVNIHRIYSRKVGFRGADRMARRDYKYKIENKKYHSELKETYDKPSYYFALEQSNFDKYRNEIIRELKRQIVLAQGISNIRSNSVTTPLMYAVQSKYGGIVDILIKNGAQIDALSNSNETALMYAAQGGYTGIVDALLQHGANVNSVSKTSETALMYAAQGGYADIVDALLQRGAELNSVSNTSETALMYAVHNGHLKTVNVLLNYGANTSIQRDTLSGRKNETALMYAVKYRHNEILDTLLESGADLFIADKYGRTALAWAKEAKNESMIKSLTRIGELELHNAASIGNVGEIRNLFSNGVNVNAKRGGDGATALILATVNGHLASVQMLLDLDISLLLDEGAEEKFTKAEYEAIEKLKNNPKTEIIRIIGEIEQSTGLPVIPVLGTILATRESGDGATKIGPEAYLVLPGIGQQPYTRIATDGTTNPIPELVTKEARAVLKDRILDGKTGAQAGTVLVLTLDAMRNSDHIGDVIADLIDHTAARENLTDELKLVIFANDKPVSPKNVTYVEFFSSVIRKNVESDLIVDVNALDNTGKTALYYAKQKGYTKIIDLLLGAGAK